MALDLGSLTVLTLPDQSEHVRAHAVPDKGGAGGLEGALATRMSEGVESVEDSPDP